MFRVISLSVALSSSASAFQPRALPRSTLSVETVRGAKFRGRSSALGNQLGPAFCETCGAPMRTAIPEGDERERRVCTDDDCGFVAYQNPKVPPRSASPRSRRVPVDPPTDV